MLLVSKGSNIATTLIHWWARLFISLDTRLHVDFDSTLFAINNIIIFIYTTVVFILFPVRKISIQSSFEFDSDRIECIFSPIFRNILIAPTIDFFYLF